MARKPKLEGVLLEEFIAERSAGIQLSILSAKYGLTPARLSQIYRSREVVVISPLEGNKHESGDSKSKDADCPF